MREWRGRFAATLVLGVTSLATARAAATDAFDFPDPGTQPLARGGAWVARATNPLATLLNPAGLAGQETSILLNSHLVFNKVCFTRAGDGTRVQPSGATYDGEVCNENSGTPTPLPQLAATYRITDQLNVGYAVAPPNIYGKLKFPDLVPATNRFGETQVASPQRYLLVEADGFALNHVLGVGVEPMENLRVGAGFIWGMATYTLATQTMATSPPADPMTGEYRDDQGGDVRAEVDVADFFMPGLVLGALYSPHGMLDIGASFTVQEAFDGHGKLTLVAPYYSGTGINPNSETTNSDDIDEDLAHLRIPNPMEVKLGVRFHLPREVPPLEMEGAARDPLRDDWFDVELDASYSRNSAYDRILLQFPENRIPVNGTPATVPPDGSVPLAMKGDTLGLRLGTDVTVIPNTLAVRAGGWIEPQVQREEYLNVAVVAGTRYGVSGGVQVRVIDMLDIEAGYMHVFFDELDNKGAGRVRALVGQVNTQPVPYRSEYTVNGGSVRQSANIFSLGATARF